MGAAPKPGPEEAGPPISLGGSDLQARLCAALDKAGSVRIADYEDGDRGDAENLRALSLEALEDTIAVVEAVRAHYETTGGRSASEGEPMARGRALCETVDRHQLRPSSAEKVGDIAFVAGLGLGHRLNSIRSIAEVGDKWEVISECSGAFREISKSLTALELAICDCESIPPRSSYYITELERALLTRRAYVSFHRDIVGPAPRGEEVPPRLRRVAAAIAKLASRDIYISARVQDRRMIRKMQERMQAWLSTEPRAEGGERVAWLLAGMRLYGDVSNACDLLLAINHRAELRAHDEGVLEAALETLSAETASPVSLADEVPELASVLGRDPTLDELIESAAPVDPSEAAALVRRALLGLRGRA